MGYLEGFDKWIKPYYLLMSKWDKSLIAKVFKVVGEENNECIVFVATDAYSMGIYNPDIWLIPNEIYLLALT